jgi:hypothetical protein
VRSAAIISEIALMKEEVRTSETSIYSTTPLLARRLSVTVTLLYNVLRAW